MRPGLRTLPMLILLPVLAACASATRQSTAAELLTRRGFAWATDSSEHYVFHAERGSRAHQTMPVVMARMENAMARVLKLLGEASYEPRIEVFVVGSGERMRALVGRRTNGVAYHRTNVIAVIQAEGWSTLTPHEVLHVVAMNRWGRAEVWLNEGLAVHAAGEWRGHDVHALARHLLDSERLVGMGALVANFRAHDDRVAYPQAGSFVRFLYERYGRDAVRGLWRGGAAAMPAVLGKRLPELEAEWLDTVRAVDASGVRYEALEGGPR